MKKHSLTTILVSLFLALLVGIFLGIWHGRFSFPASDAGTKSEIEGNANDLVSFSVKPGDTVSGVLNFNGTLQGAYFFEANIRVNIVDKDKNVLRQGHATATTDWMTAGPVSFAGSIDLTGLPQGPGYIQIANDNASGLPENDKFIYIPIIIGPSSTSTTYTYRNHGFTIELPKGFVPQEEQAEAGPGLIISMPVGSLTYYADASWREMHAGYDKFGEKKIGQTTFKIDGFGNTRFYWFKQGNVGYEFGGTDTAKLEALLKTFKFVGWSQ